MVKNNKEKAISSKIQETEQVLGNTGGRTRTLRIQIEIFFAFALQWLHSKLEQEDISRYKAAALVSQVLEQASTKYKNCLEQLHFGD